MSIDRQLANARSFGDYANSESKVLAGYHTPKKKYARRVTRRVVKSQIKSLAREEM